MSSHNIEENIDFKNIPISAKLAIARRKVASLISQLEIMESINKDLNTRIRTLEQSNKEFLKSNIELNRKANDLEEKVKEIDLKDKITSQDRIQFKKSEFYKERGLLIKSKSQKIKKLEKQKRELTEMIIARSLKK